MTLPGSNYSNVMVVAVGNRIEPRRLRFHFEIVLTSPKKIRGIVTIDLNHLRLLVCFRISPFVPFLPMASNVP